MARTLGLFSILPLCAALSAVGCRNVGGYAGGEGDGGTDADSDADTDTDADTDADTDTDTDTDTDSDVDDPSVDDDGDGYTNLEGDCDDEDEDVNPDAIEVVEEPYADGGVADPVDDDCDGETDEVDPLCDDGIALDDIDPMNGARALELCEIASADGTDWGVISAAYVRANGVAAALPTLQIGVQSYYGTSVAPLHGATMLGLSSGTARTPGQPGACGTQSCTGYGSGTAPPGFPQDVPDCPGSANINDDVGLELHLRAPSNAVGYRIEYRFYSFEFPEFVCTSYNDQFIALVEPPPDGSINGNVAFDTEGNPVSVNIVYFTTCAYDSESPEFDCPDGPGELAGTGFDGSWGSGGATAWLTTTVPVEGGADFTVRFAIWDTGDQILDSTVLIDGFEWIATGDPPEIETVPVD